MKKENNFTNVYNLLRIFIAKMHEMSNHLFQHVLLLDLFQKSTGNHIYLLMPEFHLLREVRNFFSYIFQIFHHAEYERVFF